MRATRSRRARQAGPVAGRTVLLVLYFLFLLFPLYWMAVTSFKSNRQLYNPEQNPLTISAGGLTLQHYRFLFSQTLFLRWFGNTVIIAVIVTVFTLAVGTLAAYSVTRLRYRGKNFFALGIFVAYLVPPVLLFIPLYAVLNAMGLIDTIWSLAVSYPTFTIPFCTWLLMGYFRTIPRELEESAVIDGASRLQALFRVVLPVALPGMATSTLFSFTLSWSQFLYGLAFVAASPDKVLAVGVVTELVRGDVFYWGSLMAGALLTSLPIILVYSFFTRYFVSGLTSGATKY